MAIVEGSPIGLLAGLTYGLATEEGEFPEKQYLYKVSRNGNFIGVLQNVITPFKFTHNINSAAAAMDVVVGQSPFLAQQDVDSLITEDEVDTIITEAGDALTTEGSAYIFGNDSEGSLVRNGNDVEVYEISERYPTGKLRLAGRMTRSRANFGGTGMLGCTILSYGSELDNYIIQTGNTQQAQQSLKTTVADAPGYWSNGYAQAFTPTSNFSLSQVEMWLRTSNASFNTNVTLILCEGDPSLDTVLVIGGQGSYVFGGANREIASTGTININSDVAASKLFSFSTPQLVSSGIQYYLLMFHAQGEAGYLEVTTAGNADLPITAPMIGKFYAGRAIFNNSGFTMTYSTNYPAAYITLYSSGGSVVSPYLSDDPSDMLTSIIDNYTSYGGRVNYGSGTIESTGLSRSYTFSLNTTLEGIKKVLELSPSDFYWRVDPATNILYFKQTNTTPDHIMVLGHHITELNLETSIENVKNIVYFSGGDVGGGVNLFIKDQDDTSLELYPQGIARLADGRVTLAATAAAIAQNFLDNNSSEQYITQIIISDAIYDITLFDVGETIGFAGFGNFIDSLVLQIVNITPERHRATLNLGVLPRRASATIEGALRALTDLQTVNNPDTPS